MQLLSLVRERKQANDVRRLASVNADACRASVYRVVYTTHLYSKNILRYFELKYLKYNTELDREGLASDWDPFGREQSPPTPRRIPRRT